MISSVISSFSKRGWRHAGLRALVPVVATLLLILQIQAATCQFTAVGQSIAGQPSLDRTIVSHDGAAIAAFPICHSHNGDARDQAGTDDPATGHQGPCPFCLVHCNAHAPLVQIADHWDRTWSILRPVPLPRGAIGVSALYPAGASPRGPPRVG